ncbi:MAG: hypothetical protein ACOY45_08390 [Pseudomonadota bacterium]
MMRWLPKFTGYAWCGCDDDGEYEGREYSITWGWWTVQVAFGRHNRRLG